VKPEDFEGAEPVSGLVAVETITHHHDRSKREVIRWLQSESQSSDGLQRVAAALCDRFGLGSATMRPLGAGPEVAYCGESFEQICSELATYPAGGLKLLEKTRKRLQKVLAEPPVANPQWTEFEVFYHGRIREENERELARTLEHLAPASRTAPARYFLEVCREQAKSLPAKLAALCRDPGEAWSVPYLQDLSAHLESLLEDRGPTAALKMAATGLGEKLHDALSAAYETHQLVVIEGPERSGRSLAIRSWCDANPHKARMLVADGQPLPTAFLQSLLATWDCDGAVDFDRAREHVRLLLRDAEPILVIDDAHQLFDRSAQAAFNRLKFIVDEVIDRGVSVVLVVPPDFAALLKSWDSSGTVRALRGRIGEWIMLPKLEAADLKKLVSFYLPRATAPAVEAISSYAQCDPYPCQAVNRIVQILAQDALTGSEFPLETTMAAINHALETTRRLMGGSKTPPPGAGAGSESPAAGNALADDKGIVGISPVSLAEFQKKRKRGRKKR
jgi:hypothetical protein